MATARDIVTGALRKLRAVDATTQPDATDADYTLGELNAMLRGLEAQSLDISLDADLGLNDTVPLDPMHDDGLECMLAEQVAEAFGKPITTSLARNSRAGRDGIVAAYWMQDQMRVDRALGNMPSQRRYRY